jgi:hypothetical protein
MFFFGFVDGRMRIWILRNNYGFGRPKILTAPDPEHVWNESRQKISADLLLRPLPPFFGQPVLYTVNPIAHRTRGAAGPQVPLRIFQLI